MASLNQKYFQTIHSQTHDEYDYKVVKPLGSPMILFSITDGQTMPVPVPIASLHFQCQNGRKYDISAL